VVSIYRPREKLQVRMSMMYGYVWPRKTAAFYERISGYIRTLGFRKQVIKLWPRKRLQWSGF